MGAVSASCAGSAGASTSKPHNLLHSHSAARALSQIFKQKKGQLTVYKDCKTYFLSYIL